MSNDYYEPDNYVIENQRISNHELSKFDLDRTYFRVEKLIEHYRKLKMKFILGPQIKMNSRYKLIWVQESHSSNNSYNTIDKYIDDNVEYMNICNVLTALSNLELTKEENVFLYYYLMSRSSEYKIRKELGRSKQSIIPIKNSCILKIAGAFDIEVRKGEKLNEEEEIEFKQLCY